MSQVPLNDLYKQQNKRLIRATFKKAIINQVYANSSTADVYFAGNPQTIIKSVPLASNIVPSQVMVGDRCRVDVFDETNPNDMVVAYIYGRTFPNRIKFNSGFVALPGLGGTALIPHGLGVTPDIYSVSPELSTTFTATAGRVIPYQTGADNTNIQVADATSFSVTVYWFAINFGQ